MVGAGGFRGRGGLVCWGARLGGDWLRGEMLGGVGATVVGDVPAQRERHGLRYDQDGHPHRLGHALEGRQTRIALAAFNFRQMPYRFEKQFVLLQ